MKRRTSYPQGHWSLAVDIPYSMGIRQGDLLFSSGQADLIGQGEVGHPDDLLTQTRQSIAHIRTVFEDLGSNLEQLVKLGI